MAEYEYNGLGRRIAYKRYSETGTLEETIRYTHDGQNMVAEYDDNSGTLTLKRSYVHGSQYIDEHVLMRNHAEDGQDYYYVLEELYSVAGLATSNGQRAEMAVYDAYGQATLYDWPPADVNGDATVNILDLVLIRNSLNTTEPLCDVNVDGAVNLFDLVVARNQLGYYPIVTTASSVGNPFYFTGRLTDTLHVHALPVTCPQYDPECEEGVNSAPTFRRIQDNRNRTYDPKHGRWLQREAWQVTPDTTWSRVRPVKQYAHGMLLYAYAADSPASRTDPQGLFYIDPLTERMLACYIATAASLSLDPEAARLLKVMSDNGCPNLCVGCMCPFTRISLTYSGLTNSTLDPSGCRVILINPFSGVFPQTVVHELTHACQLCLDPKTPHKTPCESRACEEIRACNNARNCDEWTGDTYRRCIANCANDSMSGNDYAECHGDKGLAQTVIQVYLGKCLNMKGPCERQ